MFTKKQFQSFRTAYIAAMLWSTNDESDESVGEPLDYNYGIEDLSEEAMDRADAECKAFLYRTACYLEADETATPHDGDIYSQAGHDFWLTRNGHGAGFWDGDWPIYGDMFTKIAKTFGGLDPYVGDDNHIHF